MVKWVESSHKVIFACKPCFLDVSTTQSMGMIASALKNLLWFSEFLPPSEKLCPKSWPHLFMKLYGKREQGFCLVGNIFPFQIVTFQLHYTPDSALSDMQSQGREVSKDWAPLFGGCLSFFWGEKSIIELHSVIYSLERFLPLSLQRPYNCMQEPCFI